MEHQQLPQLMIRRSGNAPMFIYQPRNSSRLIFLARLRRRLNAGGLVLLGLGFVFGVIIGMFL